jgi:TIR domain
MATAFISYAWDSVEHKAWVRRFAEDLRRGGIEVWLDQDELQLGDDVTSFMERGVSQADVVLLVCTENFGSKANERHGGVGYEQAIVTSELLQGQPLRGRFVCLLRRGTPSTAIPRYLQARLWVDCRNDAAYAQSLQQILAHVLRRDSSPRPQIGVRARPSVAAAPTAEPGRWVLVAGTGVERGLSAELEALSRNLGDGLMVSNCGLVTGGWPGVDEWVARSFAESAHRASAPLEDRLVQVIVRNEDPAFSAGQLVFVDKGRPEWDEPIRRADVVLLLGGLGGTRETGQRSLALRRPVLPIADSGGDAKALYLDMLKRWQDLEWMGLSLKDFQQLGRPAAAAVEAAVQLVQEVHRPSTT